jgi:Bax protein
MKKIFILIIVFLLVLPALLAGGCRDTSNQSELKLVTPPERINPQSYRELNQLLRNLGYTWKNARQGVPNFILTHLPDDMEQIAQPKAKKRLFFLSLLPMAIMINEEILAQRASLTEILDKLTNNRPVTDHEVDLLRDLARSYKIKADPLNDPQARQLLLNRVDIVPPALLLAQAANESAYGTSRFAQQANNLFGEWTFTPGTGLVPDYRPAGERYEVRLFPDLMASLKSYVDNINTHWAYSELRSTRLQLRIAGERLTGQALASGLELYSARRLDYVDEIVNIIRYNRLSQFNDVKLRSVASHQLYRRPKPTQLAESFQ